MLQVVWESQLSTADEAALQDALLQRLAEREVGYYGKPGLSRPGAITKGAAPGMVLPMQQYPTAQPCSVCPFCTHLKLVRGVPKTCDP